MYRMKVTALIDDQLVKDVREIAKGETITESMVIALREWVSMKRLSELTKGVKENPVAFKAQATKLRSLSRRRS
jgi:hypothetical protein